MKHLQTAIEALFIVAAFSLMAGVIGSLAG